MVGPLRDAATNLMAFHLSIIWTFPLFGAELIDDGNGFEVLQIGGPNIDGIRLGDELNPGLLDLLGILPGSYIKDPLPEAIKIDGGDGTSGDTIGFLGTNEINTTAGDVLGGNAGMFTYTLLDINGNNTPRPNDLSKRIIHKPETLLIHGENDDIVPCVKSLEAKDFLERNKVSVELEIIKNCGHHIPIEASSIGLKFIKKIFDLN